jgi:hypothetical protein
MILMGQLFASSACIPSMNFTDMQIFFHWQQIAPDFHRKKGGPIARAPTAAQYE